jgi:hypothetical protein
MCEGGTCPASPTPVNGDPPRGAFLFERRSRDGCVPGPSRPPRMFSEGPATRQPPSLGPCTRHRDRRSTGTLTLTPALTLTLTQTYLSQALLEVEAANEVAIEKDLKHLLVTLSREVP